METLTDSRITNRTPEPINDQPKSNSFSKFKNWVVEIVKTITKFIKNVKDTIIDFFSGEKKVSDRSVKGIQPSDQGLEKSLSNSDSISIPPIEDLIVTSSQESEKSAVNNLVSLIQPGNAKKENIKKYFNNDEKLYEDIAKTIKEYSELKIRGKVMQLLKEQKQLFKLHSIRTEQQVKWDKLESILCNIKTEPAFNKENTNSIRLILDELANKKAENEARSKKRQLVIDFRQCKTSVINNLSDKELEEIYSDTLADKVLTDSVQSMFSHLLDQAQISPDIRENYSVNIKYQPMVGKSVKKFTLEVPKDNYALGYGLFALLKDQGFLPSSDIYDGETKFLLTKQQLEDLKTYTTELKKWYEDFLCIVGDLLGQEDDNGEDGAAKFVRIGQKTVTEIIDSTKSLTSNGKRLINSVNKKWPVLLFKTMSINLEEHQDRDFLKERIENIYEKNNMKSANGKPKTFIDGTYSTNLDVKQLSIVSPELNMLLKLQKVLTEATGTKTLHQAIVANSERATNYSEVEAMQSYKVALIYEIFQDIKGPDNSVLDRISVSFGANALSSQSISSVEAKAFDVCESILSDHTMCSFRNEVPQESLDENRIEQLYKNGTTYKYYADGAYYKNIDVLLETLRNCPAYTQFKASNPGIDRALNSLKYEFTERLNRFSTMPNSIYHGHDMINEAFRNLESFVGLLVFKEEFKLTDSSINDALNSLAATPDNDTHQGCNRGLAGRMQSLIQPLVFGSGDKIKDCIKQFLKQSISASFSQLNLSNSESAMSARYIPEVERLVGISNTADQRQVNPSEDDSECDTGDIVYLLLRCFYTPVSIYRRLYAFVREEFWRMNSEGDDEGIYNLMTVLEVEKDDTSASDQEAYRQKLDKKFRVRGNTLNPWQFAFFQQEMPKYLVRYLIKEGYIIAKSNTQMRQTYLNREGRHPCRFQPSTRQKRDQIEDIINREWRENPNPMEKIYGFGFVPGGEIAQSAIPS